MCQVSVKNSGGRNSGDFTPVKRTTFTNGLFSRVITRVIINGGDSQLTISVP